MSLRYVKQMKYESEVVERNRLFERNVPNE